MRTRKEILLPGLTALILLSLTGCGGDDPATPGDTTAPAAVTDLRIESVVGDVVTLAWTAPGDDGNSGTARAYDIRYADFPVTEGNWESCTQASTEPVPAAAGTGQSAVVNTGGAAVFHFALKTRDESSNWSGLSNVVTANTGGGFIVRQLTNEGSNDNPCVDDGYVVWVHFNVADGDEIYIANLEAAIPVPERLTDNGGEKGHPNNHGAERIVWEGRASSSDDWEIWVYDFISIPRFSQFTDNDVPDRLADLAGGGNFAWLQGYTMYEEVHYWNESGHSESVISGGCCPTSQWSNEAPSADDYTVVWRSYDRVGSEGFRAYLWNGAITDITDAIDAKMTIDYSLHAGGLAYEYGNGPTMIKYWDGATVHDVGAGYEPSLYSGTIAYEVFDGHDWEIRYWDGTAVHDITDNDYDDVQSSLYGSTIAWAGRPPGSAYQIFYVDVTE
jgi:hypothetical protein